MNRPMKAMDLSSLLIDAEMVGKIYALASNTMSAPDNDSCEAIAVNLLDKALDAALEVHDGTIEGVVNLENNAVKLKLEHPLPLQPSKPTPRKRGGTRR